MARSQCTYLRVLQTVLRPEGYNEEKWHWSYMPLSQELTDVAERYLRDQMIAGFRGSEVAPEIGVVEKYVLGINNGCRH